MSWPVIEVEIKWNLDNFKRIWNEAKILARDTKKELDKSLLVNLEINVASLQKKLEDARSKLRLAKKDLDKEAEITLRIETNKLTRDLTEAKRQLNNYVNTGDKDLSRLQSKFDWLWAWLWNTFSKIWTFVAWLWITKVFSEWVTWITTLGTRLEQTTIAFTSMLKSSELASNLLKDLSAFAKETPFEINWIRTTAKQLLAFWFQAEEIVPTLKKLWDVSAWLSVPIEQVAYAYWQVRVANQLYWTELRQFVNAWIPLLSELAKQFWVTESQAKKLVEDWKVSFADVEQAFANMTSAWWLFEDAMSAQSKTVAWLWSNLKDTLTLFAESIWTSFLPALNSIISWVLDFTTKFPTLTKVLWLWTIAFVWLWGAIALIVPAIWWLTTAFIWLRTALLFFTWPIWLIIWVLTTLVGITYSYREELGLTTAKTEELSESQKKLNDITESYWKRVDEINKKQDELNKRFDEWTISNEDYKKATENNKKALEELALSQTEVQKWLDIINNKQLNYKEQVKSINWLKLSRSEYDKLISALQSIQQETLKAIRLQQELLKSKIAWLKVPTAELKKASAELNEAFNQNLTTWEWSLVWNKNQSKLILENWKFILNLTWEQINAQKEYDKQLKESTSKNSKEINAYNLELEALKKQEEELVKISREAQDIIKKPVKTWWGWWWDTWWTKWESAESKAKKEAEKILNIKTKALEDEAKKNIEVIQRSELKEKEKAEAIIAINKKLQQDLLALKWDVLKLEEQNAQDIIKIEKEKETERKKVVDSFYDSIDKWLKESTSKVEAYQKKIDSLQDSFENLKNEATKDIKEINADLEDLELETQNKVAERQLEILEEQKKVQNEINELKSEWVSQSLAESLWKETLESMKAWWVKDINWQSIDNLLSILELLKTQRDLEKELTIAKENTNEKTFNEIKRIKELTETERILEEQRKSKAVLEERKKIDQAILDWTEINLEEIKNRENIAYAEWLIAKQTSIQNELALVQEWLTKEKKLVKQMVADKMEIEKEYSMFFKWEINKRIDDIKRLAQEMKNARIESQALQSGQVINTNNNTNVWGINVYNQTDWESAFNKLMP